jgi:hypothetical protein
MNNVTLQNNVTQTRDESIHLRTHKIYRKDVAKVKLTEFTWFYTLVNMINATTLHPLYISHCRQGNM